MERAMLKNPLNRRIRVRGDAITFAILQKMPSEGLHVSSGIAFVALHLKVLAIHDLVMEGIEIVDRGILVTFLVALCRPQRRIKRMEFFALETVFQQQ